MKVIGDYERIADHAVNILQSAEELQHKGSVFSEQARKEYDLISDAVEEILDLSYAAFKDTDLISARMLSAKLDDVPFVSLFWVESHWKGGPSAHCLM